MTATRQLRRCDRLDEIFYWLLNMSIIASVFGMLIYLLRYIRGIPRLFIYALWAVVFFRLVCPVGMSSKYSLLSLITGLFSKTLVRTIKVDHLSGLTASNMLQAAETYNPVTYKTELLKNIFSIASVIWIIVAAAALLSAFLMYYFAMSEIKHTVLLKDNVYFGKMTDTPALYGILRPRIVLPEGFDQEHLDYILLHEKVHMKRRDNLWRMLAVITACLHWFNPFIWFFLKCFLEDCELACDEEAIKGLDPEERRNYARTLLACEAGQKTVFASAFAGL